MTLRKLINQIVELYHSLIDSISELIKAGWDGIKLLWQLILDMPLWYFIAIVAAICFIVIVKDLIDNYIEKKQSKSK
jgi:ABC-type proline/glycine betaine transport system permease subunit